MCPRPWHRAASSCECSSPPPAHGHPAHAMRAPAALDSAGFELTDETLARCGSSLEKPGKPSPRAGRASDGISPERPSLPDEKKRSVPPTHSRWETDQRKVSFDLPVTRRLISEVHLHVCGQHETERPLLADTPTSRALSTPVEPRVVGADWSLDQGEGASCSWNVAVPSFICV